MKHNFCLSYEWLKWKPIISAKIIPIKIQPSKYARACSELEKGTYYLLDVCLLDNLTLL